MTISLVTQIELYPGTQIVEFDSSARTRTYRVEMPDGRHFQVNEKLYELLECLRVPTALGLLAERFQQRTGEAVAIDELQRLSVHLEEQGVILRTGQALKPHTLADPHADSFMALHYRRDLVPARVLAPLAGVLQVLFTRTMALVLLTLIAAVHGLFYLQVGFPPTVPMENVNWPVFYCILMASFLLHELGHLAACRRWRCPHGPLGFGLYFFNPVFYVDVTAAWRLSRRQRAVIDLGGVYVQLVFISILWLCTGFRHDATFLLAILVTDLIVLGNFEPLIKLDGYWLLSDLAGVPNLHARAMEIIQHAWTLLRRRLGRPTAAPSTPMAFAEWSPRVRGVVFSYVVLAVVIGPLMMLAFIPLLFEAVASYPALWSTALAQLGEAFKGGDMAAALAALRVLFLPTLMLLNLALLAKRAAGRLKARRAGR